MTLRIGELAPDFVAPSTEGDLSLHAWSNGSWVMFFSHPGDFTPVCTTELGRTAQLADEFSRRNVKPLGLSTDSVAEHRKWIQDINRTQKTLVRFPVLADSQLRVARLYEMIHPAESDVQAIRSVFIIDPVLRIRLIMTYPLAVGRNFHEILRAIDALQFTDRHSVATPADWIKGDPVMIPCSVSSESANELFPQGWQEIAPYLRLTVVK